MYIKLFIAICIALAAAILVRGDIMFHTDIARDFLLFEDIIANNHLTLIGPRSGGISGVFHGPLWLYLNTPAYILANGNPTLIGWFWFLLVILTGIGVYITGKKLFSPQVALVASALYASCAITFAPLLFNPFGAVMLAPIYFYFLVRYLRNNKMIDLTITLFTLGLIIQFQIAFGGPLLLITSALVLPTFFKSKQYTHILSYLILLIPLSTYFAFELRHDFLQTRAVLAYITQPKIDDDFSWAMFFLKRAQGFLWNGIGLYTIPRMNVLLMGAFIFFYLKTYPRLSKRDQLPYRTFICLYGGFWLLTLLYHGEIWGYYTWPFLPIIAIIMASIITILPHRLFYLLLVSVALLNFGIALKGLVQMKPGKINQSSWRFYEKRATTVFTDAPQKFGYFIFTPDQFGYSDRYAIHYVQKNYPNKQAQENVKMDTVYLLVAPPPSDRPFFNHVWWQAERVKITKKPVKRWNDGYGFFTRRYMLTTKEQQIQPDSTLIHSLIFR